MPSIPKWAAHQKSDVWALMVPVWGVQSGSANRLPYLQGSMYYNSDSPSFSPHQLRTVDLVLIRKGL